MSERPDNLLNERTAHLLRVLVQRYIREGQPVGSKTLAEDTQLSLSPASIRNIMAELEERGYLQSPHTSAGRIPTTQAYRFFVDSLLVMHHSPPHEMEEWRQQVEATAANNTNVFRSVTSLLSGITQLAGIVTLPKSALLTLRHVEFLPLSGGRILVILVLNEKEVQNRIITTSPERHYSPSELQQAANFINLHYAGMELPHIRKQLFDAMQNDRHKMESLLRMVADVAEQVFASEQPDDLVVEGQDRLLGVDEITNMQHLRSLFDAFAQKREILRLLDQCLNAQGVQIFIGGESGHVIFDDFSLVTAPYHVDDKLAGVLGVIGPTRMYYDKIIPMVDITAKLLSTVLNKSE